jgi:hypothetical protein
MPRMNFKTNPVHLKELLSDCGAGKIQLPDFQRSWVWDEERIKSLIASVSQAFPVGALMTLEMKPGVADTFARRPVQGAKPGAEAVQPDQLLLDGQQRMTSLYQTCIRNEVVTTITPRQKLVKRWFYIDILKALAPDGDREEAIVGIPEDKRIKENFDKDIVLDLSTPEQEYQHLMFPLVHVFDWDVWQDGYDTYWLGHANGDMNVYKAHRDTFTRFKNEVLENFKSYQVPVIALGADTSHEAVCLVFEKVNTGGKPLDAFELVTAMYAAKGHRLRDDWFGANGQPGLQARLATFGRAADQKFGVLEKIQPTEVLQAIALLHTKSVREAAIADKVKDSDLPAVRAGRQSLLDLPLEGYLHWRDTVEAGFKGAAKFLRQQGIYRVFDLPYQSQLVPLAAILAVLGERAEHAETKAKIARWFWCGIFGELYGSAADSRFAKDIVEVPAWILDGGPEPTTVRDGRFRPDRLRTMYSRQSAAYKGVNALLLRQGAKDFRTGQPYDATLFFDEGVDIHHVFPAKWCSDAKIPTSVYDSIINKTPIAYRTNRKIGGVAPSIYLDRLERGIGDDPPLTRDKLDAHLASHGIDPALLRSDAFDVFLADREKRLLTLIAIATGHEILIAPPEEPRVDLSEDVDLPDDIARDAGLAAAAE